MAAHVNPASTPPVDGEAATVVVLRDGAAGLEVLLLERLSTGSFGGAWAFPGGRVDPEDSLPGDPEDGADDGGSSTDAAVTAPARVRRAAVRETREETGLVLNDSGLVAFSRWVPPAQVPKRLVTWFFLAADPGGELLISAHEHVDSVWMEPAAALDSHATGTLTLFPPTWITLNALRGASSVAAALASAPQPPALFSSVQLRDESGRMTAVLWEGDAQYRDLDAPGTARHRLTTARLPWVYEQLKRE
jgi:8-oxo-dGTP pyrophosphatase MutT (NUDIX family)